MIVAELWPALMTINGVKFTRSCSLEAFYPALGNPSRTDGGPPAPSGHRNNQLHFFDDLGIYLLEHHARRNIEAVTFVFNLVDAPHAPARAFSGKLFIAGQQFDPTLDVRDYLRVAPLPFKKHLTQWYYYDGERISITLTTFSRRKTKSGRWSRIRGFTSVDGGFRDRGLPLPTPEGSSGSQRSSADGSKSIEKEIAELATGVVLRRRDRGL